ncbi:5-formyltetrahydrofolate cyclo-ligase [uncultured Sphingomonas sp.]|uniref:5-formyltetrahydrofolate cyclo-ligase n=1 Tax=uncultured Sphingomonas sp. TaxID=158754 RepID=UPI0035C9D9D2
MTDKQALRAALRAARDRSPGGTILVPQEVRARLAAGVIVTSYVPIGSEADPAPLVRSALTAGCTLAMPHVVSRSEPLRFLAWSPGDALVPGPFGLSQPASTADEVDPAIILTPLVGFDRHGNRLGQGAGYYDRAFARFPRAWRIGVALAVQEVDSVPTETWDVPLHAIVTEQEWITP